MNHRVVQTNTESGKRMLSETEWRDYCGLGRNKARELAKQIGIIRRVGSRVLYDKISADRYFDSLEEETVR